MQRHSSESEDGATSTEYLFLMVFVALAIVVGSIAYGNVLGSGLDDGADRVSQELAG